MEYNSIMEKWKDEYLKEDKKYENHVSKFSEYIKSKSVNKENRPASISKEDVVDCIGHYNEIGQINTIKTMENHIEAIKAFYKVLVRKEYTQDIFNNISSFQEFKEGIAEKFKLKELIERESFTNEVMKSILEKLDLYFKITNPNTIKGSNNRKRYNKNILLRLFVKLTLVSATKRGIVCSIKKSDFSENFRKVTVNGVNVLIPNGLHRDIINGIEFIEKEEGRTFHEKDKIFDYIYGRRFVGEKLNEWFCSFLKEYEIIDIPKEKETYSVEVIMNTAIINMVMKGANPAYIAKINGNKISAIEKKYYENEKVKIEYTNNLDSLINNEVSKSEYYNYI